MSDPVRFLQPGLSLGEGDSGAGGTEGLAEAPGGRALFEMLRPDSAAPGGWELDAGGMILPGHQADFDAIVFNWALYLEPLGAGTRSALGPDLPLAAYAIGYSRPKRGALAETRYSFSPGRVLAGLLIVLCAGLLVSGVVTLAVFLRRRGG